MDPGSHDGSHDGSHEDGGEGRFDWQGFLFIFFFVFFCFFLFFCWGELKRFYFGIIFNFGCTEKDNNSTF